MSGQLEQPRALSREEWMAVFEVQALAQGLVPAPPFDDTAEGYPAITSVRLVNGTMAIDPRDAVYAERAATYVAVWRGEAARGRGQYLDSWRWKNGGGLGQLPPGVIQSFLNLGETPPVIGLKETAQ